MDQDLNQLAMLPSFPSGTLESKMCNKICELTQVQYLLAWYWPHASVFFHFDFTGALLARNWQLIEWVSEWERDGTYSRWLGHLKQLKLKREKIATLLQDTTAATILASVCVSASKCKLAKDQLTGHLSQMIDTPGSRYHFKPIAKKVSTW